MFKNKKILLGISGSIAAYKTPELVRQLIKNGAEVQVVATDAALTMVSATALATVSNRPVYSKFVSGDNGQWTNHVELGLWADIMLIAPASAHTLAKCCHGICSDLLTAVYLSAKCPVVFAPAMDLDMYAHPSTIENIKKLRAYGHHVLEAEHGQLASGLEGKGRMPEPETLVDFLNLTLNISTALKGKKVLITAGPTQEALDPVRFISNHSSGKMGYALADAMAAMGAVVTVVSGPVAIKPKANVKIVDVKSAENMFQATSSRFAEADIVVFAAAVADYTPIVVADQKIKKNDAAFNIELKKTVDIAGTLGPQKREGQIMVGFALETEKETEHALAKLHKKKFDFVVLNSLNDKGAGFQHDTNKIKILTKTGETFDYPTKPKTEVALDIIDQILKML